MNGDQVDLTDGAERAAARVSEGLKTSRREYWTALLALEDYARGLDGDELARQLLEEVERARTNMVAENLLIRTEFGLQ